MRVGLVVHAGRPDSREAAGEAARLLDELDVEVVAAVGGSEGDLPDELSHLAPQAPAAQVVAGLDLTISFGGDGTFLRAAHLCRDAGIPVLGVNLGRLGFLAEVERADLGPAMRAVAAGQWRVEERPTLTMEATGPDGEHLASDWALNEVAVEKTVRQRLVLLDVHLDGTFFAQVPADALILATATGSTAYALSAGGPIVSPRVAATLVVPVAPHSLFDRTVLAGPGEVIRVELLEGQAEGLASCDGRPPIALRPGAAVTVVGGGRPVLLARVGLIDFPTLVRRKFGLR
ncbi:MAG: NAD(+)/NADH kinase [Nitriliruptoraceae bacterium]